MKLYLSYAVINPTSKILVSILFAIFVTCGADGQVIIPLNDKNWTIQAQAHVFENYQGKDAIYIQQGTATLKDATFKDGTIEFDVYLTERQSFPGVYFRVKDNGLFDAVYLDLKKGENKLLLAISEDFGGWGVTGKFADQESVTIRLAR